MSVTQFRSQIIERVYRQYALFFANSASKTQFESDVMSLGTTAKNIKLKDFNDKLRLPIGLKRISNKASAAGQLRRLRQMFEDINATQQYDILQRPTDKESTLSTTLIYGQFFEGFKVLDEYACDYDNYHQYIAAADMSLTDLNRVYVMTNLTFNLDVYTTVLNRSLRKSLQNWNHGKIIDALYSIIASIDAKKVQCVIQFSNLDTISSKAIVTTTLCIEKAIDEIDAHLLHKFLQDNVEYEIETRKFRYPVDQIDEEYWSDDVSAIELSFMFYVDALEITQHASGRWQTP